MITSTQPLPKLGLRLTIPRISAPVRVGMAFGLGALVALFLGFQIYLHYCFEGYAYGPFLLCEWMPIPEQEREAGYKPVCFGEQVGWDGMYYFAVANDPLLKRENPREGLDIASYRYQRVGMPMVAHFVAKLAGQSLVSPWLYHLMQFAFTALGFGVIAGFLASRAVSPWYALGWLASGGVVHALYHGLADAPGDALFAVAVVSVLSKRLITYAISATLLCLCREGYAAFCAPIFLLSAMGCLSWAEGTTRWKKMLFTAIPGIVLLAWSSYVAYKLNEPLLNGSRSAKWGFIVDWPFFSPVRQMKGFFWADNGNELRYAIVSVLSIVVVLFAAIRQAKFAVMLAAIPLVILAAMTGDVVWFEHSGHGKNIGYVLVLGTLLLPFTKGAWLRLMLGANILVGIDVNLQNKVLHPPLYSPNWAGYHVSPPKPVDGVSMETMGDFRSTIELLGEPIPSLSGDGGFWKWMHRPIRHYKVIVSNTSSQTWYPNPQSGPKAITLVVRLYDSRNRVRWWYTYPLPKEVGPGQAYVQAFGVPMPAGTGTMTLKVGLSQGPADFFADHQPDAQYMELIQANGPREAKK